MLGRLLLLVIACGFSVSSVAQSTDTTEIIAQAAGWSAYRTLPNAPRARCGIDVRHEATARYFTISYTEGERAIVFLMNKQSWSIPANTSIPISLRVDQRPDWRIEGTGRGTRVQWQAGGRDGISFIQEFHSGMSMVISFPGGNEPPWRFSLEGTAAMVSAMLRCMSALQRPPEQPTQPFRAPPSEPTQPFAARPRFQQEAVPDAAPADRQ